MKQVKYRKIVFAVLWIIAIAGLMFSLGFVNKRQQNTRVEKMSIRILNNDENLFLSEQDVKNFFKERNDSLIDNKYRNISVPDLEKALNSHPAIENAEVSEDLDGNLQFDITQRTPVVRVINKDGESYYIDNRSMLMPLNENYSARVMVASGEIFEPYSRRYQFSVNQIKKNKLFSEVSVLDDILDVTNFINGDSTLSALIHQVYVNKDRDLELYPAIGNHKIIFGTAQNMAEKFNRLKLFYTQGLNKSDAWTKYSVINLKYKNLVVCTKK